MNNSNKNLDRSSKKKRVCAQVDGCVLKSSCLWCLSVSASVSQSPYRRKACNSYLFGSTLMCRKILSKFNDPKGRYRFSFLLRQYFICDIDLPQVNVCLRYTMLHVAMLSYIKGLQLLDSTRNKDDHSQQQDTIIKKTSLLHVHISSYVCTNIYVCMLSYTHITHKHVNVYLYVYVHMCVYMQIYLAHFGGCCQFVSRSPDPK